ncbi:hypothetical protein [uncultured Clostridium sp.]|uniref:hypothetical protein n=1 Tax=uncultured Clostridium sp. TaxID=59620 RepID=UPI0025F55B5D|nr:hypothetical protein [uncultured Clostridium sp.]
MLGELSTFDKEKISYEIKLRKVFLHIKKYEYDEALYELQELKKRYPYMSDIYNFEFKIYCIKKKYVLAKRVSDEALKRFPKNKKIESNQKFINDILLNYKEQINFFDIDEDMGNNIEKIKRKEKKENKLQEVMDHHYYRVLSYRMMKSESEDKYYNEANRVYKNLESVIKII